MTFVDGQQHDFWRVDEARLRAALRLTRSGSRSVDLVAGEFGPDVGIPGYRVAPVADPVRVGATLARFVLAFTNS